MTMFDSAFDTAVKIAKDRFHDGHCRIVYLRPNLHSDERLAIGIIVSTITETYFRTIANSEPALTALRTFIGEENEEQVLFALRMLDRHLKTNDIIGLESPSDLLQLGQVTNVSCENIRQFAQDLLEISSSLYRAYQCKAANNLESINQDVVTTRFYHTVTEINAFKATGLFKGAKVQLSGQSSIEVPIIGDRILGGPVSFVTPKIGGAKTQAEALIAKYSIAGRVVQKKPAIYILTPSSDFKANQNLIEDSLHELQAVADGHQVLVRHERSLSELAHVLLRDEAA